MNTATNRQTIEPATLTAFGAVRLVKVERPSLVDVEIQNTFVDVTPKWIDRPWAAEDVADFALDIADEYDAEPSDVFVTIGNEANGLPILWVVARADYDTVSDRLVRERLVCLADHGRYNERTPSDQERQIEVRLERGLVRAS